jgi:hypothetical protein
VTRWISTCELLNSHTLCDKLTSSGCPQGIARRGRYGSFLQDDWELIHKLSKLAHTLVVEW